MVFVQPDSVFNQRTVAFFRAKMKNGFELKVAPDGIVAESVFLVYTGNGFGSVEPGIHPLPAEHGEVAHQPVELTRIQTLGNLAVLGTEITSAALNFAQWQLFGALPWEVKSGCGRSNRSSLEQHHSEQSSKNRIQ